MSNGYISAETKRSVELVPKIAQALGFRAVGRVHTNDIHLWINTLENTVGAQPTKVDDDTFVRITDLRKVLGI